MNPADLFHTKEPDEVVNSCRSGYYSWDLSGRFPVPQWDIECPQCSSHDIQLSRMQFSEQPEKGCPYTADIYFKCRRCSFGPNGFQFGVKIPKRMYKFNNRGRGEHNRYEWRTIRDWWQDHGVIETSS